MAILRLEKELLRTISGPDLEFATDVRLLRTPTLDLVAGGTAGISRKVIETIIVYSTEKILDSIIDKSRTALESTTKTINSSLSNSGASISFTSDPESEGRSTVKTHTRY